MSEEKLSPRQTLEQYLYAWRDAWKLKNYSGLLEYAQGSYIKSLESAENRRKIVPVNTNDLNSIIVPKNAEEYLALLYNSIQIMGFKNMTEPNFPAGPAFCEITVNVTFRARFEKFNQKYSRNLKFNLVAEIDGLANADGIWGVNPPSAYTTLTL